MSRKTTIGILTILALVTSTAAARELSSSVLGNSGELYEVLSGRYEELFPQGDEIPGQNEVLALEVTRGGTQERYLLPGTESLEGEGTASLFYERTRGSLVALWRGGGADKDELLNLVTFADGKFSDAYVIADPTLASLAPPRLVVTHDRYDIQISETEWESIERTILHLLWTVQDESGIDVRYSPLIFVEGVYSGWNQVVSLSDTTANLDAVSTTPATESLCASLDLAVSDNGQRVVASFVNSRDGRLRVVEIGVLPLELVSMGDEIREVLNGLESSFATEDLSAFADNGRLNVVNVGRRHRLHPAFIDYLAEEVGREILVVGGKYSVSDYHDLVEHLRTFTLETAAPLVTASSSYPRGTNSSTILEVDVASLPLEATGPAPLINLRVLNSLEPPRTGVGEAQIFASSDGRDVLVSWQDGQGRLSYVENQAGGWSEPRSLVLGDRLSAQSAYEVLERRVR